MFNINEKLVVAVFGYEINLVDRSTRGEVVTITGLLIVKSYHYRFEAGDGTG